MEQRVPPLRLRCDKHKQWYVVRDSCSSDSDSSADSESDFSVNSNNRVPSNAHEQSVWRLTGYDSTSESDTSPLPPLRTCGQCDEEFDSVEAYGAHRMHCRPDLDRLPASPILQQGAGIRRFLHASGLDRSSYVIRFAPEEGNMTMQPDDFFNAAMPYLEETRERLLGECQECRVHFVIQVRIIQIGADGEPAQTSTVVISIPARSLTEHDMEAVIREILDRLEKFVRNGSNWIIEGVDWFDYKVTRYRSIPKLRGHGHFSLPERLKNKQAVVNVDNGGGSDCFLYAVLSVLHYDDVKSHRDQPFRYKPWLSSLNLTGIEFPMTAAQIAKFEKNNPGLRINLLKWDEDEELYPVRCLYHTKGSIKEGERIVCVLAVDGPTEDANSHFVGVVNLDRLLNERCGGRKKYCERCLQPFRLKASLEQHRASCYLQLQETLTPPEKSTHRFTNWGKQQRAPYVVYADLECTLVRENDTLVERHVPAAFGFLLVAHPNMKQKPLPNTYYVFTGEKCIEEGLQALETVARRVYEWNMAHTHEKVEMTPENWRDFKTATVCYMCEEAFIPKDSHKKKVIEHDHLTGAYRGAACQDCNSNAKLRRAYLPVFFHNLRNYDMHAMCISGLGKQKSWQLTVIPQTEERYMALTAKFPVGQFVDKKTGSKRQLYMTVRFLDSFQFMNASLDSLVRNLSLNDMKMCATLGLPSDDLITAKGVFPYSYFDSLRRLEETQLPPIEAFRSSLTGQDISAEDYARAQDAWTQLKCRTFGDYMHAYLKRDVYQLADVFECFRNLTLEEDGLDPVYYTTLPGLTWDSAFKKTKAVVDLLTDAPIYEFVERGIRGGMTFINEHHLEANTPRVPETFNPDKPLCDLLYIDANNLYGHALSQRLPQSNFRWLSEGEVGNLDVLRFDYEADEGHLLEVDLEYPPDVQDRSEDLPFAPEQLTVDERMLTPHMRQQWSRLMSLRFGKPDRPYKGCPKLLLTHFNREKYVVHGRLLQFYLRQGLVLTKVHRVLAFRQAAFLQPYIAYNSQRRQNAKNTFSKEYYKLKNNALFGKTMENVRRRINFKLCNSKDKLMTYASRPEFLSSNIFNEDLVGVRLCKDRVVLDKPIYIGQAVLDLSKLEMFELRYDILPRYEQKFGGHIRAAGGDTDSFFLKVEGIRVERDLLPQMLADGVLDSSNFPSSHPLYSTRQKAQLGCVKDESEGKPFREWMLLRPKNYCMVFAESGKEKKTAKGVRKFTLSNEIRYADYRRAYEEQLDMTHLQRRIGSLKHQNYTLQFKKRTLTFFEDKRAWTAKNASLPYGNHRLTEARRPPKRQAEPLAPECLQPEAKRMREDDDGDESQREDDEADESQPEDSDFDIEPYF